MRFGLPMIVLIAGASPALAANVNLNANLVNSCVLSVGTNGVMTASSTGIQIGSENNGGSAAALSLVAIGSSPTVTFGVPSLSISPNGWSGSPTVAIRYTSTAGANQGYTSSQTTRTSGPLSETFTVHGKVDNADGFASGNYTLTTVVTCSQ